jgi:hypothetical protein
MSRRILQAREEAGDQATDTGEQETRAGAIEDTPGTTRVQEIQVRIQQRKSQEQEDTLGKAQLCIDTAEEEPGAGGYTR